MNNVCFVLRVRIIKTDPFKYINKMSRNQYHLNNLPGGEFVFAPNGDKRLLIIINVKKSIVLKFNKT